ncbi:glycoside hydrolase family protein [Salix suchowensis]|nr:glycoside hydrolase family protein [Salix suchowensis]
MHYLQEDAQRDFKTREELGVEVTATAADGSALYDPGGKLVKTRYAWRSWRFMMFYGWGLDRKLAAWTSKKYQGHHVITEALMETIDREAPKGESTQCGHSLHKMKLNDGFWLLKNGVKPFFGLQVTRVLEEPDGYTLHVSTRPIRHRGDTLGGVVGVNIEHFANGDAYPSIPLFPNAKPVPAVFLSKPDSSYSLSTGGLTAEITENPYTITFKSPKRILTSAGYKHQGLYDVPVRWTTLSASNSSCLALDTSSNPAPAPLPPTVRYIHSELNLSPGELVYGFGEQFGAFVKNVPRSIHQDLESRNYGVFINHPGEVEVEVGSEKVSRVGVSVADKSLEYFIIYGETPLEVRLTRSPSNCI